ncbi:hypothetical protein PCE1_000927 [Barthelona sp. PCE]
MPPRLCEFCGKKKPAVKRIRTPSKVCSDCFILLFEEDVFNTVAKHNVFERGDVVGIGLSGGKDSVVMSYCLQALNIKHNWDVNFVFVCIDEGISGYRDDSIETVRFVAQDLDLPLHIFSFKDLYEHSMDEICGKLGTKQSCSHCGVLRRKALNHACQEIGITKMCIGHNADDVGETLLLNFLRCDVNRLSNSTTVVTGDVITRIKPLLEVTQKDIILYAFHRRLRYFSTECPYACDAFRGVPREMIQMLTTNIPSAVFNLITTGDQVQAMVEQQRPTKPREWGECEGCGTQVSKRVSLCSYCMLMRNMSDDD